MHTNLKLITQSFCHAQQNRIMRQVFSKLALNIQAYFTPAHYSDQQFLIKFYPNSYYTSMHIHRPAHFSHLQLQIQVLSKLPLSIQTRCSDLWPQKWPSSGRKLTRLKPTTQSNQFVQRHCFISLTIIRNFLNNHCKWCLKQYYIQT